MTHISLRHGRGRDLHAGDQALTSYSGRPRIVRITGRRDGTNSPSGIEYRVSPPLARKSRAGENGPLLWYDADWFDPVMGAQRASA